MNLLKSLILLVSILQIGFNCFGQSIIHRIENSPYPSSVQPDTLFVFSDELFSHSELLLLQSIQGLCAKLKPKIYRDKGSGSSIWIQDLEEEYSVHVSYEMDGNIDTALTLIPQDVYGYILCNLNDNSSNVANSLCGPFNALAVTPELQDLIESKGYTQILDVRDKDEQWVIDNYAALMNERIITYQREDKCLFLGDYSILSNALHVYDDIHSTTTENAFAHMEPNSVLFGWGDDEYQTVAKASEYSIGVHPADWGFNISTLTNFNAQTKQQVGPAIAEIEENTHTVCFLMSDGDNIQWMLNLFAEDSRWFGSENRGLMDIGWTIPPSLSEVAPTVMAKIYSMAASTNSGKDYFVAGPSGYTYHFPELFPELEASCALMNGYLEKSDLRIVNILGNAYNDSIYQPELKEYLKQEQVDGLFYYDYSNYSRMKGSMDCYGLKPIVSAKYNLWGGFETGESLAHKLNNARKDPYSVEGYTLVAVHAWSNSVDSLLYVNDLLDEGVRVVAPDEFIALIRKSICAPQFQNQLSLEAFPNPFHEAIQLRVQDYFSDDFVVSLEDMSGKSVPIELEKIETLDGWILNLYTHGLRDGAYLLHFITPDENKALKVFKYD